MRIPQGHAVGNIAQWQTAVGEVTSAAARTPVSQLEQALNDLRTMRAALSAETDADKAAIPSLASRIFSRAKRDEGQAPRAELAADRALMAQVNEQIETLTRVSKGARFLKFDGNAADDARCALIKGLPTALSPDAWVALEHIAKADPNAEVRAASAAKTASVTKMHSSGSSISDNWLDPRNPMSQFGPGPSFWRR